jgi:hypothetical protein
VGISLGVEFLDHMANIFLSHKSDSPCRWCQINKRLSDKKGYLSKQFASCWFYPNHVYELVPLLISDLGTPMQYMVPQSSACELKPMLNLTKVPLKIWWRWRCYNTLMTFELTPFLHHFLRTNANLGSACT